MLAENYYQVALTFVPQVGAVIAKTLVSYCGGAEGVFRASKKELLKIPGVGPVIAENILSKTALQKAEREIALMETEGIEAVFYTDERFPARLRQISDSPVMIFFKGSDLGVFKAEKVVAIVGTRKPTELGKIVCEEIVEGLKNHNALIVSGLAYGIDVSAHKKAVSLNMPNVGVLGHGLGRVYPEQHFSIAQKMAENGGLLTEYPYATPPDREHFPMRNRIVAGLSDCVVVVETGTSGGSMITAELAWQYDRPVFAVPGRVRDPNGAGCNQLIKNEKAKLVECAADIANHLRWQENGKQLGTQTQLFLDLSPKESLVVETIRSRPEIPIDELTLQTKLSPGELASLLLGLEFKAVLRTLPGKRYILV